jgi:uncharacterized protein YbaP (TraB family)
MIRHLFRSISGLILVAGCCLLTACGGSDDPAQPNPAAIDPAGSNPDASGNNPRHMLWEIRKGERTHWMVGSIHIGRSDTKLPKAILSAYSQSQTLLFELDLRRQNQAALAMAMQKLVVAPPERRLAKIVDAKVRQKILAKTRAAGIPDSQAAIIRPWILMQQLMITRLQQAKFGAEYGIDQLIIDKADKDKKTVLALEKVADQAAAFNAMSAKATAMMLEDLITSWDTLPDKIGLALDAWAQGNHGQMWTTLDTYPDSPAKREIYDHLLTRRNKNWMPQLTKLFASDNTTMVVVGAAHLIGPDNVLDMLKKEGYTITQK